MSTPPHRVVVTGLGVFAAPGLDVPAFWQAVRGGESAIRLLRSVDTAALRFHTGAEIAEYDPQAYFDRRQRDTTDRFSQFALLAAAEALADAGLDPSPERSARTAVVTGTAAGGLLAQEEGYERIYRQGIPRVHPLTVPRIMSSAGASHIAMAHGFRGPALTVSTACASATHAIGQAFWMVRSGLAEVAVTGGSEAPFTPGNLVAWDALRVVAPDTCRPFSVDRKGLILGEGAAMLVLEPLEAARARGATCYAEIVGFGMTADAGHLTAPDAGGAARAMQAALDDAGLAPEAVGYVNAHGTGTAANDAMEAQAMRRVFGTHADRLAVSSTKGVHGHALGAAGALEAVATVLAVRDAVLPPTANVTALDPACDLDVITGAPRPAEVDVALSNSFAFGGLNAVLAFRRIS
ncbi:beta-ACP synthase [Rhodothermaceae bacterium RA]|nr:beta-ACP synthase [Rhodothermaceae bacterium RA]